MRREGEHGGFGVDALHAPRCCSLRARTPISRFLVDPADDTATALWQRYGFAPFAACPFIF
jgi:hypothetical protein